MFSIVMQFFLVITVIVIHINSNLGISSAKLNLYLVSIILNSVKLVLKEKLQLNYSEVDEMKIMLTF